MKVENIPLLLVLCISSALAHTALLNQPVRLSKMKGHHGVCLKNQEAVMAFFAKQNDEVCEAPKAEDKLMVCSSVSTPMDIEQRIAVKAQIAYDIYLNFVEEKSSFLENHFKSIREKLTTSASLRGLLGNVFSYIYKEDRVRNGYRPLRHGIPEEFTN